MKQREAGKLEAGTATAGHRGEAAQDRSLFDKTVPEVEQQETAALSVNQKQDDGTRSDNGNVPRQGDLVVASYDYIQSSDTDISMQQGEIFLIEDWNEGAETDDWALVRRLHKPSSGSKVTPSATTGYVPYAYLEKAPVPVLTPPAPSPALRSAPAVDESQNDGRSRFVWKPSPSQAQPQESTQRADAMFARFDSKFRHTVDDEALELYRLLCYTSLSILINIDMVTLWVGSGRIIVCIREP